MSLVSSTHNLKHQIRQIIWLSMFGIAAPQVVLAQPDSNTATEGKDNQVEEVVVTGIRQSIQTALQEKRDSDVIIDGISADDMGNFPDLNLGEALQRIPGVQIDRNAERRNASITVRGLPGAFALTTVQGQSVASAAPPGRSANPFGVFDSSIFSGTNVVKSFTAATQSGGLSANIDLRIKPALERKDGQASVRAEYAYEELSDAYVPSFFASGSKHFIEDTLAAYATAVWKEEDFRRDSIVFNGWANLNARALGTDGQTFSRAGLPANAQVLYTTEMRQNSEISIGDRLSAATGVEFKPNDNWSFALDGIYTKRNLDEASNQLLRVSINADQVRLLDDPVYVGVYDADEDARNGKEPAYVAHSIRAENPLIRAENRTFPFVEEVFAVYPKATFENEDWKVTTIGTLSQSETIRAQTLYNVTIRDSNPAGGAANPAAQVPVLSPFVSNGIWLTLNSGLDNYQNYVMDLNIPAGLPNFQEDVFGNPPGPNLAANTQNVQYETARLATDLRTGQPFRNTNNSTVRVVNDFTITGGNASAERDLRALALDIERSFDDFNGLKSIRGGLQYKREASETGQFTNSAFGTNYLNLNNSIFIPSPAVSSGDGFFGGTAPFAEIEDFLSVDTDLIRKLILPVNKNLATRDRPISPLTGYIQIASDGDRDNTFSSERRNAEAFVMANFNFADDYQLPLRGNVGVRYVDTRLQGRLYNPRTEAPDAKGEYDALLPSLNMIYDITDDITTNFAYYETFEAFDLSEFSPRDTRYEEFPAGTTLGTEVEEISATDPTETIRTVKVNFNSLDLEPRSSEAFDLGVAWYNREGSIVGMNYFQKSVRGTISREVLCPTEGVTAIGETIRIDPATYNLPAAQQTKLPAVRETFSTGPLLIDTTNLNGNGTPQCRQDLGFRDLEIKRNPRISIGRTITNPDPVTIRGLEFQVSQDLSFMDGWVSGFGGTFNYTYIDIEEAAADDFNNVSPSSFNIIGFYETDLFSVRLAGNFRSEYAVLEAGTFVNGRRDVAKRAQWDLSSTLNPTDDIVLRFEAFNLTDAVREEYEYSPLVPRQYEYDGRTYSVSIQYTFK